MENLTPDQKAFVNEVEKDKAAAIKEDKVDSVLSVSGAAAA